MSSGKDPVEANALDTQHSYLLRLYVGSYQKWTHLWLSAEARGMFCSAVKASKNPCSLQVFFRITASSLHFILFTSWAWKLAEMIYLIYIVGSTLGLLEGSKGVCARRRVTTTLRHGLK